MENNITSFKSYLMEYNIPTDGFSKILSSSKFNKNAAVLTDIIVFEFKDSKSASTVMKKNYEKISANPMVINVSAGPVGLFERIVLGLDDKSTSGYISIEFNEDVPTNLVSLSKANKISDREYQKLHKAYMAGL